MALTGIHKVNEYDRQKNEGMTWTIDFDRMTVLFESSSQYHYLAQLFDLELAQGQWRMKLDKIKWMGGKLVPWREFYETELKKIRDTSPFPIVERANDGSGDIKLYTKIPAGKKHEYELILERGFDWEPVPAAVFAAIRKSEG